MNIKDLQSEWMLMRSLTIDLLKVCSENDLNFSISSTSGEFWKQFRHIGRIHENYLQALESKSVEFQTNDCTYYGGSSKKSLLEYFEKLNNQHQAGFGGFDVSLQIDWFGQLKSLESHLLSLLTHETLHHGQLLLYWRALGHKFPHSCKEWGE